MRWAWVTGLIAFVALAGTATGALVPQDDASSGQDAPDEPLAEVSLASGEVYDGLIEGLASDPSDHYAFRAEAGDEIEVLAAGSLGCISVKAPNGTELDTACTVGYTELSELVVKAPQAGTYFVEYSYLQAQHYRFSLGVDEPAPEPAPTSGAISNPAGSLPDVAPAEETDEHTVVAVVDTGINLYHEFFAAPQLDDHPSAWLDGFPSQADAVDLTLDADSYEAALDADRSTLTSLERSTYEPRGEKDTHLYTFPGTRIAAAISFGEYAPTTGSAGEIPILDEDGHGTGSAALAAGASLDRADGNVLVVAVEVPSGGFDEGLAWAVDQPWIDALSVSLGTVGNVPYPTAPLGWGPYVHEVMNEAGEQGTPVFVASGNGFTQTGVGPDHCTTYTSAYTGPPPVTRIGAAEPGTQNPSSWHCVPVDAIAATPVVSAGHESLEATSMHSGTSAATPNAVGHWAQLHQRAESHGLELSRAEINEHLLHAARPADPEPAPGAEPSTPVTAPLDQGYGVIDGQALERATQRLLAGQPPAERPYADAFFAQDEQIREQLWGPSGAMTGSPGATTAAATGGGAGVDVPDQRSLEIAVEPGSLPERLLAPFAG